MGKKLIISGILLLLSFQYYAESLSLNLIKTIGDERDDYTLFSITDAIVTETKDIFILDTRGNFVSQYDWNGTFKRRIGQKGQGPGDFYFPWSLAYSNGKLYVHDKGNHRIVELNLASDKFEFYKEDSKNRFSQMKYILDGDKFMGVYKTIKKNRGRIGITDKKFNTSTTFLNDFPIDIDVDEESLELKEGMAADKMVKFSLMNNRFEPVYHYDEGKKEILVSFRSSDNPVRFYVFDTTGKRLKTFSYPIDDKRFKFFKYILRPPGEQYKNRKTRPAKYEPYVKVFITKQKGLYGAFLALNETPKGEKHVSKRQCFLLLFDRNGNLQKKIPLYEKTMMVRYSNGYFLSTRYDEDVSKLYIYRIIE